MLTTAQKQLIEDFQLTFGTQHGKRAYEAIKKWSRYEDSIMPNEVQGMMEFDLGRRDLFLQILDKVEADMARMLEDDQQAQTQAAPNKPGQQQQTAIGGTEEDASLK